MSESQDSKCAGSLLGDSPLEKGRMKRWDYLIMAALTCVYAVVALTNLGSFDSPTSAWRNATARTAAVIDLGGEKEIAEFWHFDGIAKGDITLETSIDGENWEDAGKLELKDGEMYKWKKTSVEITARYLKLTPQGSNLWVNEMALWDKEGKLISPAQILSPDSTANSPLNLFDEQGFVPAHPTYMNEMYFDEIYHARTALEHIEGMPPYENTHPPLGKVFIAAGIKVFGMNPFGWRISGTLFGIFMVPLIYIFAKRLFKETKYAFLATVLMSFDFMHFTQTRIATIDSYAVFFIIAMFYFMYRYYEMSFYKDKMWKTLAMLGLSGLMFGLGCATKWICIYAGAGLAVLFFIVLWRRWQEYRYALRCADDAEGSAKGIMQHAAAVFYRNLGITLGCASLFFIVIPALIYYASYFPYMMVKGHPYDFQGILNLQKYMFDYHSGLKAGHPYASAWYLWPIIGRPIWFYYQPDMGTAGVVSSISSFGNPLVWLPGLAAAFFCTFAFFRAKGEDKRMLGFVLIALASQYVPWILVPRATFIYHYFASVPFIIMLTVYCVRRIERKRPKAKWLTYAYIGLVVLLFGLFYPILSGVPVQQGYLDFLRWSPSWVFHL